MTAFRAIVLEHFRRPHNRGPLEHATGHAEGANALCGDRIRIQVRVANGVVEAAGFTADACAVCIASASVLTVYVRGLSLGAARGVDAAWVYGALDGEPPRGRLKCALLPLETLHRAVADAVAHAP